MKKKKSNETQLSELGKMHLILHLWTMLGVYM